MKKAGIITTITGILVAGISVYDLFGEKNCFVEITVTGMILGVAATFMGPAFSIFPLSVDRRRKIAKRSLIVSFSLILFGIICMWMHWLGARVEIIFGVLIICFFYGALSVKSKYEKWRVYTRSKYDALFLSMFDFVGIGALVLSFLFRVQHWPLASEMAIAGISTLAIGVLAWNQKFKKEVVFRKEAEDQLKISLEQIEIQHEKLEEKQKEIIDSIRYARRIQSSLMPTEKYIESSLTRLSKSKKSKEE